jgi:hypothetical protein
LLESCYEVLLAASLARAGLAVERQKAVDIEYRGISVRDAFRADLVIERRLVVEVKAIDRLAAIHSRQVLTYLRLLKFAGAGHELRRRDLPRGPEAGSKQLQCGSGTAALAGVPAFLGVTGSLTLSRYPSPIDS